MFLRPISCLTLELPQKAVIELKRNGFEFVEDLINNPDELKNYNIDLTYLKNKLRQFVGVSALDAWQEESQGHISVFSTSLDNIISTVGNGFQCGSITQLFGGPNSGKTQICMQLAVSVRLKKEYGGLNSRAIYIDTRNGISSLRLQDIINGYKIHYKDFSLNEDEILAGISVISPRNANELLKIIRMLKPALESMKGNNEVRLIIVDSLSLPLQCCISEPSQRIKFYDQILQWLQELAITKDLSVVITNELTTQIDANGMVHFTSAGGQTVNSYTSTRLELTRLVNHKFAAKLLKSSTTPEMVATFEITAHGVRNVKE